VEEEPLENVLVHLGQAVDGAVQVPEALLVVRQICQKERARCGSAPSGARTCNAEEVLVHLEREQRFAELAKERLHQAGQHVHGNVIEIQAVEV